MIIGLGLITEMPQIIAVSGLYFFISCFKDIKTDAVIITEINCNYKSIPFQK